MVFNYLLVFLCILIPACPQPTCVICRSTQVLLWGPLLCEAALPLCKCRYYLKRSSSGDDQGHTTEPGCQCLHLGDLFFPEETGQSLCAATWTQVETAPGLWVRGSQLLPWLCHCCSAMMSKQDPASASWTQHWSSSASTTSSSTLPSLTTLTKWVPPPRGGPAATWAKKWGAPSFPWPKAKQSLSWGHLCSRRHISENAPDHRVPTVLCFCWAEPRAYRFPALKIH